MPPTQRLSSPPWKGRELTIALRIGVAAIALLISTAYLGKLLASLLGWGRLLGILAVAEVCFVPYYFRRAHQLNQQPTPHRPPDCNGAVNMSAYMRVSQYFKFSDKYLCPWFCGAPMQSIKHGNVLELLAYGFWYSTM